MNTDKDVLIVRIISKIERGDSDALEIVDRVAPHRGLLFRAMSKLAFEFTDSWNNGTSVYFANRPEDRPEADVFFKVLGEYRYLVTVADVDGPLRRYLSIPAEDIGYAVRLMHNTGNFTGIGYGDRITNGIEPATVEPDKPNKSRLTPKQIADEAKKPADSWPEPWNDPNLPEIDDETWARVEESAQEEQDRLKSTVPFVMKHCTLAVGISRTQMQSFLDGMMFTSDFDKEDIYELVASIMEGFHKEVDRSRLPLQFRGYFDAEIAKNDKRSILEMTRDFFITNMDDYDAAAVLGVPLDEYDSVRGEDVVAKDDLFDQAEKAVRDEFDRTFVFPHGTDKFHAEDLKNILMSAMKPAKPGARDKVIGFLEGFQFATGLNYDEVASLLAPYFYRTLDVWDYSAFPFTPMWEAMELARKEENDDN